ncbi:MAG: GntR family transcriptional regulator [Bacteroidetes bacterium]|nr:GntR family transcriptional regulator [Bacteroidota bacterium]
MLNIGEINELEILRETLVGLYLGDDEENDVLLPNKYVPETYEIGDKIEVFLYRDSEDRPVATTLEPKIKLNDFAPLTVRSVTKFGAFLDWGMEKDLLVPFSEQLEKMHKDETYLVYMYLDGATDRLVASSNLPRFIKNRELTVEEGEEVDLIFSGKSDLGWNVIINKAHWGLIYYNELFANVSVGDRRRGFVFNIREDNKIDVRLRKSGYEGIEPNAKILLEAIRSNDGFLPLTDKSAPEDIQEQLEMSKKVFKKAVGALYKQKIIRLEKDGLYLV